MEQTTKEISHKFKSNPKSALYFHENMGGLM